MVQTGFIIGVGLLIDTFVVRTITVPAVAAMIGRANWWPSKPTAANVASFDIPIVAATSAADIGFSDVRKACSTSCLAGEAAIVRDEGRSWGEGHTSHVHSGGALSLSAPARGAPLIRRPMSLTAQRQMEPGRMAEVGELSCGDRANDG